MVAEDLSKAALEAIDDWLDEEIVGFEGEILRFNCFKEVNIVICNLL